ncbi:hypothetical protein BU24DRAFT_267501 [Aaosphaeria arxii CBS 175.79]|uniref:Uncharacterized protein n=1 Tax=Aaosphaeria arxii CBS 175.79 TaxID=1450172 RepID=A0A6A5XGN1_9PLEO|nr:uncharacterized protein BU24DRAFT_267501 [Aaosphaeria arxii CBS 175.79]KAF2011997.1 hypothetical protein BU24DRAFT_267501 [Aaosphaeria arxii CBS 175.79]
MGTPHRGLPPPSAMTLPDPGRGPPPISSSLGSLPPAPSQYQSGEDGMRNWLAAKAEEDKRKQEEEKTRQESLRLEQRKIEQSMLRESMQGGIPPQLVPMIFAGLGGGTLASLSAEWLQQYTAQLQQQQQQQQQQQPPQQLQQSPDARRDQRLIGQVQSGAYGAVPPTPQAVLPPTSVLPGQPLPPQPQHAAFSTNSYASSGTLSPRARAAQTTGHPPVATSNVQQVQSQSTQQEQASPSIYFHHWVPPSSQGEKSSSGNPPPTPSGKYKASPSSTTRQRALSHASDLEYTSSPKKRKNQSGHPPPPPPTSAPQPYTSPSFSHISTSSTSTPGGRGGHARARSDASTRGADSGSLSRRGTISSHGHSESSAQQTDGPEHRYQAMRGHESQQHQYPPPPPSHEQSEAREYRQRAHTTSSMPIQTETHQPGPRQQLASHDRGSVPTSPKREVGGQ